MALNSQIALGVKAPEIVNPLALYSQALGLQQGANQNALAQYTLAKAQREDADQNMLRQALQGADINTPEGQAKARNALLSVGNVKGASEFDKNLLERRNTQSQISERDAKRAREGLEILSGAVAPLVNKPDLSHNDIFATGGRLEQMGILDSSWKQGVPMNAAELPAYVSNLAMTIENGRKALELRAPKTEIKDVGNALQQFNTDKLTGATTVGPVLAPKTPEGFNRAAGGQMVIDPGFLSGKAQIAAAGRPVTNIKLPDQEKAFESELGKEQAKSLIESKAKADDAASIITNVNTGRQILNQGMVTGFGAETLVGIGQALKQAGIDFGGDATSNSQAYAANMAQNVGKIIKQFGAGTGLSNADREYAEKMAGGKITLDEKAIRKILDINERAATNIIQSHNKKASGVKTNIPLTVDVPKVEAEVKGLTPAEQSELDALRKRFKK